MASPWLLTFSSGERPRALWALLLTNCYSINRLTSGPYFSYFLYFLIQSPTFPYFLKKRPYYPYFLGCHVVKLNNDFRHKIYFLLIKNLSLLLTMYIWVHFKLSFKNTLTTINCVKIPIFAAATPCKCGFIYQICQYKRKKIALLSLLLSSKIPTLTLLFKNVEPYVCPTLSQKVTGQPV